MKSTVAKFLEFNGRRVFLLNADGTWWIAIKPICEALGLDWTRYFKNVKADRILSQLLAEQPIVAADGRQRKMVCLPERFIYGWLFTINSDSPALQDYRMTCYDLLYNHFHGTITARTEAIRERVLAMREMDQLRRELSTDGRWKRLQELQSLVMHKGKELKEADKVIENQQMMLFETTLN